MAYVIGSQKGKDKAKSMKTGETYKASDGSTWTKQADGSVSVKTSKGETFNNAYTPTAGGGSPGGTKNNQYTGSAMGVTTHNSTQQSIQNQMNANSIAWWSADETERKRLEQENRNIAALLGEGVTFDPGSGTWSGVADGSTVDEMKNWNNNYIQQNPQPTQPTRDPRIDELLNQILNRDKFSYDVENDPLYQQYAQMYQREGDRAMRDTLSEVAASAGGMNSYAITAAQQANNYYNSQLADKVPELFQLAYDMYLKDIERDVQNMGILKDMDATQYNRYRDTINDWYNDKQFAYNAYTDAVGQDNWQKNFDNNNYWANKEFDHNDMWKNKEYTDNRADIEYERNQYDSQTAYDRIMEQIGKGVTTFDPKDLEAAGLTQAAVDQMIAEKKRLEMGKGTSSGGGSSRGSGTVNGSVAVGDDDFDDVVDPIEDSSKVGTVGNGAPLVGMGFSAGATFEAELDYIAQTQGNKTASEALQEAVETKSVMLSMPDYLRLMNKYSG